MDDAGQAFEKGRSVVEPAGMKKMSGFSYYYQKVTVAITRKDRCIMRSGDFSRERRVGLNLANTLRIVSIFTGLMLPAMLLAQFYDNPGLGQKPVAGHPQDYKPLGVRAGSFMLHPGVQLAVEFNDNVFYTRENKQNDTIYHIRPTH